jgi:long-chain acyl-CoA synthetase
MNEPKNVVEMFLQQVRERGDATALRWKRDGRWVGMSWREWEAEVRRLARGFVKLGLQPRQTVTIAAANRPEWVHFDLAVQMAGGVTVPVYPSLTGPEARYIVNHAEARYAIVENAGQLAKMLDAPEETPAVKKILLIEGDSDDPRVVNYRNFRECGADVDERLVDARWQAVQPGDVATYVYTSGTTGQPKGAMLTHDNLVFITGAVAQHMNLAGHDVFLSYLPLSHVYERVGNFYSALRQGIEIGFAESLEKMPANLLEVRPTILGTVPRVLEKVYAAIQEKTAAASPPAKRLFAWALAVGRRTAPYRLEKRALPPGLAVRHAIARALVYKKIAGRFGGRVRLLAVAGAPMSREIAEFFYALDLLTLEGYGMTECSAPATLNTHAKYRFGTVGYALPGVEIKIAPDGEILLRGRGVFAGYYRMPEATAEALAGGWLHTGDIGALDADGMLRITDRKKDLIVTSGGKNIAPQKIENMLIVDACIAQAVVIGDQRHYLTALIVPALAAIAPLAKQRGFALPDRAAVASSEPLIALIRERVEAVNRQLPKFETIKDFRLLDHDLTQETGELTPTMKVKRKAVLEHFRGLIDDMYSHAAPRPKEETS